MVGGASRGRRRGAGGDRLRELRHHLQQRVGGNEQRASQFQHGRDDLEVVVGQRDHDGQYEQGDGPGQRQGPDDLLVRHRHPDQVELQRQLRDLLAARAGQAEHGRRGQAERHVRHDQAVQATYDGHPLYTYAGDSSAGQVNGNGLKASGGLWWAMTPSGAKLTSGAKPSPSKSKGSGGGGYGY
jgi:Secreted repeat of unknown function